MDMLNELLCNLRDKFSLSDILTFLSMIVAIIAAFFAWLNKRKAAKSETEAKQYAKNADEANQSAKKYYEIMYEQVKKQDDVHKSMQATKEGVLEYINAIRKLGYSRTFNNTDLIKEAFDDNPPRELQNVFKELELEGCIVKTKINDNGIKPTKHEGINFTVYSIR